MASTDNIMNTNIEVNSNEEAGSVASSITSISENEMKEKRRMKLIEKYNVGKPAKFCQSTLTTMNRVVRTVLIPQMKFVSKSKQFGSFEQPDFEDETCWVHKIFDKLGSLKNASNDTKAAIWMQYRNKVKEQIGLHWSTVTKHLKTTFVRGKHWKCLS